MIRIIFYCNRQDNTKQTFVCTHGLQQPGKARVIRTGTGLLARAPIWCDYRRCSDDCRGETPGASTSELWAASRRWEMGQIQNS